MTYQWQVSQILEVVLENAMEAEIKKEGGGRQGEINGLTITCALFDNNMFNNIQVSTTKIWGNACQNTLPSTVCTFYANKSLILIHSTSRKVS